RRNRRGSRHPSIVASVRVEIFSDVVCPWCYIGKRRFDTAVANLTSKGTTLDLEVLFKPYQLDPTAPPDETTPVYEAYAKKFGGQKRAAGILAHVTELAARDNIEFRMDRALRANTMLAHRLLFIANRDHGSHTQTQLEEQLFKAYFTDGANIGDVDVLVSCATEVGMKADQTRNSLACGEGLTEVETELRSAAEIGISAVPTFVFNGQWSVPGAQDVDVFERILLRLNERIQ
ncbi:MAG: DsbA family oxidoreductase, partial [Ilumatobacteraceae bacterium]